MAKNNVQSVSYSLREDEETQTNTNFCSCPFLSVLVLWIWVYPEMRDPHFQPLLHSILVCTATLSLFLSFRQMTVSETPAYLIVSSQSSNFPSSFFWRLREAIPSAGNCRLCSAVTTGSNKSVDIMCWIFPMSPYWWMGVLKMQLITVVITIFVSTTSTHDRFYRAKGRRCYGAHCMIYFLWNLMISVTIW